jgi:pilus assembly protein Flp/PilA
MRPHDRGAGLPIALELSKFDANFRQRRRLYITGRLHPVAIRGRAPAGRLVTEPKMNSLVQFLKDESGATAIEYGLIAAGISVAIIAVVSSLGSQLQTTFSTVSSQLATAGK